MADVFVRLKRGKLSHIVQAETDEEVVTLCARRFLRIATWDGRQMRESPVEFTSEAEDQICPACAAKLSEQYLRSQDHLRPQTFGNSALRPSAA